MTGLNRLTSLTDLIQGRYNAPIPDDGGATMTIEEQLAMHQELLAQCEDNPLGRIIRAEREADIVRLMARLDRFVR